jgi:hypothetical protein
MRTRDELERLAVAGRPLLAGADALVDAAEEGRILARILASDRPAEAVARRRSTPRALWAALVLVGAVVVAAGVAVVSTGVLGRSNSPATRPRGDRNLALSGARIELAGYEFKTPAGFKASSDSCVAASSSSSGPVTVMNGFAAAASADGGCIEAFGMVSGSGSPAQHGAEPVAVGAYQGYYVPEDDSGESTLYIQIPASGDLSHYLALFAEGLTEQQLIAIAQSGLPPNP